MAFKVFLIYHSHIDIGYTERQEKIACYQADFIRQAVDCVLDQKQKAAPFKFTAEGFWAIEQYLNKYGVKGEERLVDAIRTKRLEFVANAKKRLDRSKWMLVIIIAILFTFLFDALELFVLSNIFK